MARTKKNRSHNLARRIASLNEATGNAILELLEAYEAAAHALAHEKCMEKLVLQLEQRFQSASKRARTAADHAACDDMDDTLSRYQDMADDARGNASDAQFAVASILQQLEDNADRDIMKFANQN